MLSSPPLGTSNLAGTLVKNASEKSTQPTESYSQSPSDLTATTDPSSATFYLANLRDMAPFRDRPQANLALKRATTHPAPIGVVITTSVAWKKNKSRTFFGHLHCPCPKRTIPPAIWPPHHESTRSLASKFIPQHCPRSRRSRRTTDPPPPQADPRPTNSLFRMLP